MSPDGSTIFLKGVTTLFLDDLLVTVDQRVSGEYRPAGHAPVQPHRVLAVRLLRLPLLEERPRLVLDTRVPRDPHSGRRDGHRHRLVDLGWPLLEPANLVTLGRGRGVFKAVKVGRFDLFGRFGTKCGRYGSCGSSR